MNIESGTHLVLKMGLSTQEIERRLHLFNFSAGDRDRLRAFVPVLRQSLPEIIATFYERQLANPDIAALIAEPATLARLRRAMSDYVVTLFGAEYDADYVESRLRIGKVHKQLGVIPKLYMSAISTLQDVLDDCIDAARPEPSSADRIKDALHRALLFDSQLVFDAYIDSYQEDMEQAQAEVNRFAAHLEIKVDALTRELHEQSLRDSLTGLFNRATFLEYLEREINVARRYHLPLCLAFFDLNGFKAVNDSHGHEAGDEVLRQVGQSLHMITRAVDIPARNGGDEFCVIMPRCDLANARGPLARLFEDFDARCERNVTFSVGLVQCGPDAFEPAASLLRRADMLMYEAKAEARKAPGHYVRPLG